VSFILFASFEGKESNCQGGEGRGGKGERRENSSLVWELRNQQEKKKKGLCDNFTILPFFSS